MTTNINIRIPKDLRDKFQQICKRDSLNASEIIRRLIANWIEAKKEEEK